MTRQALCHWCNDIINTPHIKEVKLFWNHTWSGFPICDWCSNFLKTDGNTKEIIKKKRKVTIMDYI